MAYFVIYKLGLKSEPENMGQVMQLPEIGIYQNRAHVVLLLLKIGLLTVPGTGQTVL